MPEPVTESPNPTTSAIDTLSSLEIVTLINQEDARIAPAVQAELAHIAQAVDLIVARLQGGGRLFYFGAGTSGRLGALDASELPPTYNAPPDLVQAFIAGGDRALRHTVEAAEDDADAGRQAAEAAGIEAQDAAVGISASGNAPWVVAALTTARQRGAATIALVCNPQGALAELVDVCIAPLVGPEVIAGSSRMKAGSAQKMVLNMLSTAAMIRLGKVYGNRMVDLRASNQKLRRRAEGMVQEIAGVETPAARQALEASGYEVKPALVMLMAGVSLEEARRRLEQAGGQLRLALSTPTVGAGEGASGETPGFQQRFALLLGSGLASQASIAAARQALQLVEAHYGLQLSETLGAPLATHLAVTGKRLLQGEQLLPAEDFIWQELRDFPAELELAARLVDGLERQLGIEITHDEVAYIAVHLVRIRMDAPLPPPESQR